LNSTPVLARVVLHDHAADSILHIGVQDWLGMDRGIALLIEPATSNCHPWLTIVLVDAIALRARVTRQKGRITQQHFLEGHESRRVQRSFLDSPGLVTRRLIANRHPPHPLEYVLLVSMSDCWVILVEPVTYFASIFTTSDYLREQGDELKFS
jgi:hypothetical protein